RDAAGWGRAPRLPGQRGTGPALQLRDRRGRYQWNARAARLDGHPGRPDRFGAVRAAARWGTRRLAPSRDRLPRWRRGRSATPGIWAPARHGERTHRGLHPAGTDTTP